MTFPDKCTFISDEVSQDLPELVRFVREFGLPGIEVRSMFGRAFKDLTPADVAEIRRVARGEGWRIFGCASPVFKCDLDDDGAVAGGIEQFRRSVDIARELDCDLVRVFTFLRRPAGLAGLLPRVVDRLRRLRELAERSGVRIGIENEHSCIVGSGDEARALFALLPEPEFGLVWDPCNILYIPELTGEVTAPFADLSRRTFHLHVKDAVRATPMLAAPVGLGDVGWRAHLAAIRRSGYRGMLSLETHWRIIPIAEEKLHAPGGYAFSHGGEPASRTCLHNLRELLLYGN